MLPIPLDHGKITADGVSPPAAGSGWTFLFPPDFHYRLDSFQFLFVADANAASRQVLIDLSHVFQIQRKLGSNTHQLATEAKIWTFLADAPQPDVTSALSITAFLPKRLIIRGGTILNVTMENIQVGDQFSNITLGFSKWPVQTS